MCYKVIKRKKDNINLKYRKKIKKRRDNPKIKNDILEIGDKYVYNWFS